jgi:hypothetical protein
MVCQLAIYLSEPSHGAERDADALSTIVHSLSALYSTGISMACFVSSTVCDCPIIKCEINSPQHTVLYWLYSPNDHRVMKFMGRGI